MPEGMSTLFTGEDYEKDWYLRLGKAVPSLRYSRNFEPSTPTTVVS